MVVSKRVDGQLSQEMKYTLQESGKPGPHIRKRPRSTDLLLFMVYSMPRPELVIFDLYGTLIQIGVRRLHPHRKILQWAQQEGRAPSANDARTLLTQGGSPSEVFSMMGIFPPEHLLAAFETDIEEELDSISIFDDVFPTLNQLVKWQVPIAICSNLAQPYGNAIDRLLKGFPVTRCLSYDVGYIKPEPEIYQWIIDRTGVHPQSCLFVGDTFVADYQAPKRLGFEARYLVRGMQSADETIGTLTDVLKVFR